MVEDWHKPPPRQGERVNNNDAPKKTINPFLASAIIDDTKIAHPQRTFIVTMRVTEIQEFRVEAVDEFEASRKLTGMTPFVKRSTIIEHVETELAK